MPNYGVDYEDEKKLSDPGAKNQHPVCKSNLRVLQEDFMECAFCGEEISTKPFRRDGEIFCSKECSEAAAEEQYGLNETGYEDEVDDDFEELEEEEY